MATLVQEFLGSLSGLAGQLEKVSELLSSVRFAEKDLSSYIFFREQFYTRNLIYQDSNWEVLALCWLRGQQTPIHDHSGSQGWAYLVEGSLAESIFVCTPSEHEEGFSLVPTKTSLLAKNGLSYIDDAIGWHSLGNFEADRSISLHIYSPMIKSCRYYSLAPRETKEKALSYFSVRGAILC